MTHLLKLTIAAVAIMTPMTAAADWVLVDPRALNPADLIMDPPVLVEIEIPGPPPVYTILTPSMVVGR